MANTSFAFGDPRAQTVWAMDMYKDAQALQRLAPLKGTTPYDIIRVNQDLTRKPGGDVVFECRDHLGGAGVGDDGDTTGNAQQIKYKNQTVRVHTRATRTQAAGMQSLQLTSLKGVEAFRQASKEELALWISEIEENDILGALTGEYNENYSSGDIETINEVYPTSARALYLGQTITSSPALDNNGVSYGTDALLTEATQASNLFGTLVIDKARTMALMATPRFQPGKFRQVSASKERSIQFAPAQGKFLGDFFVCLASPYQLNAMRSEVGSNGWAAMQAAAGQRGNDNPIFSGGASLRGGVLIIEYERIPIRTGAGGTTVAEGFLLNAGRTATDDPVASGRTVARALFLGANAGIQSWAKPFGWWEDMYDANKPIVKTEGLYGVKVNQWNSHGGTTAISETSRIVIDTMVTT